MGRLFLDHMGGMRIYCCRTCTAYLTSKNELVSSRFQGSTGRAYLFDRAWNIELSEAQIREMMTGKHWVRDVSCKVCKKKLGWMYEFAMEESQRYKESKVILEKALIEEMEGIHDPIKLDRAAMGRKFLEHWGGRRMFHCENCRVYLSNRNEVMSTVFKGTTGRAFLFRRVVNIRCGETETRELLTGKHIVRDVFCVNCAAKLGWQYEFAEDDKERYKEGSVILERKLLREVEEMDEKLAMRLDNDPWQDPTVAPPQKSKRVCGVGTNETGMRRVGGGRERHASSTSRGEVLIGRSLLRNMESARLGLARMGVNIDVRDIINRDRELSRSPVRRQMRRDTTAAAAAQRDRRTEQFIDIVTRNRNIAPPVGDEDMVDLS